MTTLGQETKTEPGTPGLNPELVRVLTELQKPSYLSQSRPQEKPICDQVPGRQLLGKAGITKTMFTVG